MASLNQLCVQRLAEVIKNGEEWPIDTVLPAQIGNEVVKALGEICIIDENVLQRIAETTLEITKINITTHQDPSVYLTALKRYKHLNSLRIEYVYDDSRDADFSENAFDIWQFIEQTISEEARENFSKLGITGFVFYRNWFAFESLPKLSHLTVAASQVDECWLREAGQFLPSLRWLDISETQVKDLSWIVSYPNLEALVLYDCPIQRGNVSEDLKSLTKLRVLDLSFTMDDNTGRSHVFYLGDIFLETILECETSPWPELRCLDLAGYSMSGENNERNMLAIRKLPELCPRIQTISLLNTVFDQFELNLDRILILNCSTTRKAIEALEYYSRTKVNAFRMKAQYRVLNFLLVEDGTDEEMCRSVEIICQLMKDHLTCYLTERACIYYFGKQRFTVDRLPPRLIQKFITRCIVAGENWKDNNIIQHTLAVALNDYALLNTPGLDLKRMFKLSLEAMLSFGHVEEHLIISWMNRIALILTVSEKLEVIEEKHIVYIVDYVNWKMEEARRDPFCIGVALSALRTLTATA